MAVEAFDILRAIASDARVEPYLVACEGNRRAAVHLYAWNIQISAAFQASLGCLEVAFRNSMHRQLSDLFGREDWWRAPELRLHHVADRIVTDAIDGIGRRREPQTPGRVITELPFGFWVSLLGSGADYETRLWRPALRHAFPGYRGRRTPLHQEFDDGRRLRNRIAHHEPIYRRDLVKDHESALRLLTHISADYAAWVREHDRVPGVLATRDGVCNGSLLARF